MTNQFGAALGGLLNNIPDNRLAGDYTDSEGFLCCGKCYTRKECEIDAFGKKQRVPCACKCKLEEMAAEKAAKKKAAFDQRIAALQREGITDKAYLNHTFSADDKRDQKISNVCHKYVSSWEDMAADNIGILFYGGVGTGKSFYACCIANALLCRLESVCVTNIPQIMTKLHDFGQKQNVMDKLQKYDLLVIDDLGVERDTSYSLEQVYNIIDTRSRACKPLIVTTNLTLEELQHPPNIDYARIYDRILEMCPIRLKLIGESRRKDNAERRRTRAKEIMQAANEKPAYGDDYSEVYK